jgi:type IX secretion system PorP/SprF family membrane protein
MRRWPIILFILMVPLGVKGQLAPLSNQYLLNTLAINPAYAGSRDALSLSMHHRNQWTGFDGSPKTTTLAMHAPLRNEKVGLGLLVMNDRVGISTSNVILANFAYRILMNKGVLSLGLGSGISVFGNNWEELVAVDQGDDLLRGNSSRYVQINFSLGAYYSNDRMFLGFSMPMFLSHNFSSSSGTFELANDYHKYNYFINGGYLFTLSPNWKLLPSAMIRYNPSSTLQVDLNSFIIYRDKIWLGISYRSNKSVVGHLIYQVNNQLAVGYSYDAGFGNIGGYMGGSHEITIRYDFRYIVNVIGPRYF